MTRTEVTDRQSPKSFDLLPNSFRRQRQIRRVCYRWAAITFTLVAIFCGLSGAVMLRAHRARVSRAELVSQAGPLADLRRDCLRLHRENKQRTQWCDWVETARPDDSALQTLAAITRATNAEKTRIKIESLKVKLPLEYPSTDSAPPDWASGRVVVAAETESSHTATQWRDRLSVSDRVADATLDHPAAKNPVSRDGSPHVLLTATPRATRVLP